MLKYVKGSAEVLSMNFEYSPDQDGEKTIPVAFSFYKISCTGDTFDGVNDFMVSEAVICPTFSAEKLTPEQVEYEVNKLNKFGCSPGEDPGERFGPDSAQDFSDDRDALVIARMANIEGFKQFAV